MAKIIALFILFLLPFNLIAQDCNAPKFRKEVHLAQKQLKSIDAVHDYYQELIRKIKADETCSLDSLAYVYLKYGISLSHKKVYQQAVEQLNEVEKIKQSIPVKDIDLVSTFHYIGEFYEKLGHLDRAIYQLQTALETQLEIKDSTQLDYRYMRLGMVYKKMGDYEKAIEHLEISKNLHLQFYKPNHKYIGEIHNILGVVYTDNKDFYKAEFALKKAIDIATGNKDKSRLISAYTNLGKNYGAQKLYKKASLTYQKATQLCENISSSNCIKSTSNLGLMLTKTKAYKEAETYLIEALNKKRDRQENLDFHYSYAATLENLGDLKLQQDNHKDALKYYQKALLNLTDNFRNESVNENPTVSNNTFIYSKIDLIRVLDLKAQAALEAYKKTKDSEYLDIAFQTYQTLDEWIGIFYRDLTTDASMLTWIARSHEIYGNAIQTALQKNDTEQAFHFAERARAVLLWQNLNQLDARNLLSEADRQAEDELNDNIHRNEQAYFDAEANDKDSLKTVILQLERDKEKLIKTFEKNYPEYYARKYDADFITLKQVQQKLIEEESALLEYFLTDEVLYVFTITKSDIISKTIPVNEDFYTTMSRFKNLVSNRESCLYDYAIPAHKLYQTLLAPALQTLPGTVKNLTILPDGGLNYIVFEALLTEKNETQADCEFNAGLPYLFKKYSINYLYSCNSGYSIQQHSKSDKSKQFLGIAPVFDRSDDVAADARESADNSRSLHKRSTTQENQPCDLSPLIFSKKEIDTIATFYNGTVLMNEQATLSNLLQAIPEADIIHIASHATQDGKIYLHNCEELTQKDIQSQTWNASHIILSACETGTGELSKGEGVLSLGWSFVRKGVPSIVMSQWKVPDQSTKELMLSYHGFLQKGFSADEALTKAKHYYFSDIATSAKEMHPYYWAAFIHTGQSANTQHGLQELWTSTTSSITDYPVWWLFILGIILFLWRIGKREAGGGRREARQTQY